MIIVILTIAPEIDAILMVCQENGILDLFVSHNYFFPDFLRDV